MNDLFDLDLSADTRQAQNSRSNTGKSAFDYLAATSGVYTSSPLLSAPKTPLSGYSSSATSPIARSSSPLSAQTKANGGDAFSSLFDSAPATPASLPMGHYLNASMPVTPALLSASSSRSSTPIQNSLRQPSKVSANADVWDFDLLSTKSTATISRPTEPELLPAPQTLQRNFENSAKRGATHQKNGNSERTDQNGTVKTATGGLDDSFELAFDDEPVEQPRSTSRVPETKRSSPSNRTPSPPPHILGQLVEMGFSIKDARSALNATFNPTINTWDTGAAAENILASKVPDLDSAPIALTDGRPESRERVRDRRESPTNNKDSDNSPKTQSNATDLNTTAVINQASEIGYSMLKTANTYWKTGKKAVQKAIDERLAQTEAARSTAESTTPKWMRGSGPEQAVTAAESSKAKTVPKWMASDPHLVDKSPENDENQPPSLLFKDDSDGEEAATERSSRQPSAKQNGNTSNGSQGVQKTAEASKQSSTASEPRIYQSSARRKVPMRTATPQVTPPAPAPTKSQDQPTAIIAERLKITANPSSMATSSSHRIRGNDFFKLGSYSEAEVCYTRAIDALPVQHLDTLHALNNRAASRLKLGNSKSAIDDANAVFMIICATEKVSTVDCLALDRDTEYASKKGMQVNLREAIAKALSKRAQANEASEKYNDALSDYKLLTSGGDALLVPAGGARLVSDSIARIRKALEPKKPAPSRQHPPKSRPANPENSAAVSSLRKTNEAAKAEDLLRIELQDAVDARTTAWKSGKESNLRALVSSLENVLWPELGWKKIGMHEVITDNKLKIQYMKAIAKLHPDKLDVNKTTLEQRMIANNVFSSLNDAWNVQQGN